jgi:hypothetical protein
VVLTAKDVKDWSRLVVALRKREGPGSRVHATLPEEAQKLVADDDLLATLANPPLGVPTPKRETVLKAALTDTLNKTLDRPDFYNEEAFKGIALDKSFKEMIDLGAKRTVHQTARMNWDLLAAAFPKSIPPLPPGFRTVRVEVQEGESVVLVLSSYGNCRWEVDVKRGGKVTGVLLCGSEAQEVAGVGDAPVVYRCYYSPEGEELPTAKHFYGFDPKEKTWKAFVEGVKEITGKDFATFQGGPRSKSETFIIRPGEK